MPVSSLIGNLGQGGEGGADKGSDCAHLGEKSHEASSCKMKRAGNTADGGEPAGKELRKDRAAVRRLRWQQPPGSISITCTFPREPQKHLGMELWDCAIKFKSKLVNKGKCDLIPVKKGSFL